MVLCGRFIMVKLSFFLWGRRKVVEMVVVVVRMEFFLGLLVNGE